MTSRFLLFFLIFSSFLQAQDFSRIKEKTDVYDTVLTAEKLSKLIKRDFSNKEDQVKAVYAWLTKNIRYDLKEFHNPNRETKTTFQYRTLEEKERKIKAINDKIVKETLTRKRAVCEGYARSFAKICSFLNIENEFIQGYVRTSVNTIRRPELQPNHAWNAVKINDKWMYVDATWGAGSENNGRWHRKFNSYYYNIPKEKYFKTHLPEKAVWRLRVGRIDKEQFYEQPIYSNDFLKLDTELIAPKEGILYKNEKGAIQFTLKDVNNKEILFGFLGSSIALKPTILNTKNNKTIVSITPPKNAQQCFLLVDRKVAIHFLIGR